MGFEQVARPVQAFVMPLMAPRALRGRDQGGGPTGMRAMLRFVLFFAMVFLQPLLASVAKPPGSSMGQFAVAQARPKTGTGTARGGRYVVHRRLSRRRGATMVRLVSARPKAMVVALVYTAWHPGGRKQPWAGLRLRGQMSCRIGLYPPSR